MYEIFPIIFNTFAFLLKKNDKKSMFYEESSSNCTKRKRSV
jgi:hypothetical protein